MQYCMYVHLYGILEVLKKGIDERREREAGVHVDHKEAVSRYFFYYTADIAKPSREMHG